ncbi:MAG TPA: ABC transporter permease, partial [Bryobacterales bacterium]|nr:ABC transporter permease [Bryobacterales bacterium]
MHSLWQDLSYGWRGLRKQPAFAVLAVLTLALGIAAATTIFSVIQNVLLDPFPYADASKVVAIQIHDLNGRGPGGRTFFQTPEFLDYEEQSRVFEEVIGGTMEDVLYTTREGTEQFTGGLVTPNAFHFLGVRPLLGRGIMPEDAKPGAPPVFVMSYKMWAKHFNLDPTILGHTFVLNGVPATLVGIMPVRFTKLGADLWRPVTLSRADPELKRQYFMFQARLKPGITMRQAEAELEVVAHRLAQVYPDNYPKKFAVRLVSWVDSLVGPFRKTLYTLAAAVALLLLIACGNVANMLLARATAREREVAIRSALGASRWRIVRQLLIESLLLALGGAAAGCLFAYAGLKALVPLIPDGAIPQEAVIRLNVPVLLFSLGVAMLTALLFGLAPALQAARQDVIEPLKDSGRGVIGGFRRAGLRNILVVVEVAMSLVLLAGAGLLMRSLVALQRVDLGLNPHHILVARLPLPRGQYKTAAAKQRFFRELLPRLSALPGVVAATETSTLPPYGGIRSDIEIPGKTHPEKWDTIFQLCSEGYIPTLQLRMLRGRPLSEVEVNDVRKVAVVNQTLVNKYFGQEDPIGRRIKIKLLETMPDSPVENPVFEIVGVIADARNQGIRDPPMPEMFIPYTVTGAFERGILVRTAGDPLPMLNSVRQEIWAVDRNVALTLTDSLNNYLKRFSYAEPRFSLILLGVFAGVGLLLVAIGVYSVIAYTVSRQTHEIGIRMALGAGRSDVFRMVLRMGLRLIGFGLAAGLLASFAVTRLIASQLWAVSPQDPAT